MKKLLITSVAVAALGFGTIPSAQAWGPCSCLIFPLQFEKQTITCYRTETRTELRLVPKTVCRTVPDTIMHEHKEKVLVPYWREEERTTEKMIVETKEETRKRTPIRVECKDEKRQRTVMVPHTEEEKRTKTVYSLKDVIEVRTHRSVTGCPVPGCGHSPGASDCHCPVLPHVEKTREVIVHSLPEPREQTYKLKIETFKDKQLDYTCPVIETTPVDQTYKVPVCEVRPKVETCKVKVLDFKEETRTERIPVTIQRKIEEVVMEQVPCTVTVQVPYQAEVWVPACSGRR